MARPPLDQKRYLSYGKALGQRLCSFPFSQRMPRPAPFLIGPVPFRRGFVYGDRVSTPGCPAALFLCPAVGACYLKGLQR